MSRTMAVRATIGNKQVQMSAEVEGYSPDVIDDLSARVSQLMRELVAAEAAVARMRPPAEWVEAQALGAMPKRRPLDWRMNPPAPQG